MTFEKAIEKLYLFALAGVAFFLPLSEWFLSSFTILLSIIWVAGGGYKQLTSLFTENKPVFWATLIFLVPVVWMINTSDLPYGFHDLLIKLPLLAFPLVIGLNRPITKNEFKTVLTVFIAGVLIAAVIAIIKMRGTPFANWATTRNSVLFISHIRLALMTNMAIFSCVFFLSLDENDEKYLKYLYVIVLICLIYFLFFLLSITGIVIFSILSAGSIIYFAIITRSRIIRFVLLPATGVLILASLLFIFFQVRSFYKISEPIPPDPDQYTNNGNPYSNYPGRKDIENGRYVWMYICEKELIKEWGKRSLINYEGKDRKNQDLRYTLIRYLTSAGLRKDSAGVAGLSETDIYNIESGIANKRFTGGKTMESMIYEIIWQIDYYRRGGNPSGHSVTQRVVYLKTGLRILKGNLLFGIGTGDVPSEFRKQYEKDATVLEPEFRDRAHNQYLTFLISFGIIGFIIILISVIFPVIMNKGSGNWLFILFFCIALLSMLTEDTLETHAGVSFFAYFYSLILLGKRTG